MLHDVVVFFWFYALSCSPPRHARTHWHFVVGRKIMMCLFAQSTKHLRSFLGSRRVVVMHTPAHRGAVGFAILQVAGHLCMRDTGYSIC